MQKRTRVILTFTAIVALVAFLYIFTNWFSIVTGYLKGEDETAKLATCLKKNGVEFYGNELCSDCEKQIKEFGRHFASITYFDCGKDKEFCPNIQEIPAWYINDRIHYGFKTFQELKILSGC